jgi:hypothetical protein
MAKLLIATRIGAMAGAVAGGTQSTPWLNKIRAIRRTPVVASCTAGAESQKSRIGRGRRHPSGGVGNAVHVWDLMARKDNSSEFPFSVISRLRSPVQHTRTRVECNLNDRRYRQIDFEHWCSVANGAVRSLRPHPDRRHRRLVEFCCAHSLRRLEQTKNNSCVGGKTQPRHSAMSAQQRSG